MISAFILSTVLCTAQSVKAWQPTDISGRPTEMVRAQDFNEYLKKAENGETEGMRMLAQCYRSGIGVAKDPVKAWEWYGFAASRGDIEAEYELGTLYRDGIGIDQNFKEAAYWFRKAASNGHTLAMLNIGQLFEKGEGVLQDSRIAAENFWRAAEHGSAEGAYRFAVMLRDGVGVPKDLKRAYRYFSAAAKENYKDAGEQALLIRSKYPEVNKEQKTVKRQIQTKKKGKAGRKR